jgi:hypothetical protein
MRAYDPIVEAKESLAMNLLMEVITKGRNKMDYKEPLKALGEALKEAPGVAHVVNNWLSQINPR